MFGLKEPELLFDVVVHFGTLVAVFIVFRHEILDLIVEALRIPGMLIRRESFFRAWRERTAFRLLVLIVAGSVPTAFIGLWFKDFFESMFSSTVAVGFALMFTGLFLFLTRVVSAHGRQVRGFGIGDALFIGLAQGLAITPGLSRSGLTISTGLFLGIDRDLAARYSFLLSIPAILGALVLEISSPGASSFRTPELAAGFLAAMLSGLGALAILMSVVRRGKLHYFSYYCWIVGLATLFSNFSAD